MMAEAARSLKVKQYQSAPVVCDGKALGQNEGEETGVRKEKTGGDRLAIFTDGDSQIRQIPDPM